MKQVNKYQLPLGTMRYRVGLCDEQEAIRLASKEGWKDGESLFDYIDPIANDAWVYRSFRTQDSAERYCRSIQSRDVFRCPEIDELKLIEKRIDGARFREWDVKTHWLLDDGELVEQAT